MSDARSIIALDVGDRRIGVAVANLEARMASPLITLDRQQHADIFNRINELIIEHHAHAIIVGLPRGMEGQETRQTAIARQFASDFEQTCSKPVYLQDEAGTSLAAKDELNALKQSYQKGDVDKLAATYILRDWLETTEAKSL